MPEGFFKKANSLSPVSVLLPVFFFLNTFLLPEGLLYTTLLTPLFLLLLLRKGHWKPLAWYLALTGPLASYHLSGGAEAEAYLKSCLLFSSVVVFITWAWYFLVDHKGRLGWYFQQVTIYNTFFVAIALLAVAVPFARDLFWSDVPIHPAIPAFPRLKLLVYEPSFYALQLAPVFLFYFLSFAFASGYAYLPETILLGIPLLLSLSFGVPGGLALALLLVFLSHAPRLLRHKKIFFATIYLILLGGLAVALLLQYFPFNPVLERIDFVLAGHDSSANGRTWQAFLLAWAIVEKAGYLLGAGLGQIKEAGHQIIVDYYNYEGEWAELARIPNAMAETLATFGLVGAVVRILAQVALFVHTRVYMNYYRLALFLFIFIYQFTGSYLTNIYEYLIWLIVFLPVFPQFDKVEGGR